MRHHHHPPERNILNWLNPVSSSLCKAASLISPSRTQHVKIKILLRINILDSSKIFRIYEHFKCVQTIKVIFTFVCVVSWFLIPCVSFATKTLSGIKSCQCKQIIDKAKLKVGPRCQNQYKQNSLQYNKNINRFQNKKQGPGQNINRFQNSLRDLL